MAGRVGNTRKRGRRHKQLLDDLREKRRYCNFKAEALDLILCRTRLGRGKKDNTAVHTRKKSIWNSYTVSKDFTH